MPVLKRVPVQWASVQAPNTQFEPAWEVQVELNKEQAKELSKLAKDLNPKGIKFREEDGKIFYRFRRKVAKANGDGDNNPPVVLGPTGEKFDKLIGNGSICNVQFSFTAYDNKFGKGVTNDLKGIRVIEHVPYGEQDGEGLMDDEDEKVSFDEDTYDEDF